MTKGEEQAARLGLGGRASEDAIAGAEADDTARREQVGVAAGLTERELEEAARRGEARRKERFRNVFEVLILLGTGAVGLGLLLVGVVYVLHLLLPEGWHWLTEEQQGELLNVLTGGLAGLAAAQIRKRLE